MDAASGLELYHMCSLPIVNPGANIIAPYNYETDKFTLGEHGLQYALPSEAGYTKYIMVSNHFCTLSTPQYPTNNHTLCVFALLRHSSTDQYCAVKLSPYTTQEAVYLGQGNWVTLTKNHFTIIC